MRQGASNDFQTPPYAARWIAPYLDKTWTLWECAAGNGNLVRAFGDLGFDVIGTDLLTGHNFLTHDLDRPYDAIVTNPPRSRPRRVKEQWLARCWLLGKPFALLFPLMALGKMERTALYAVLGIQLVIPPHRINFFTPSGEGSGAWLFAAWFTWGLNLPRDLIFAQERLI